MLKPYSIYSILCILSKNCYKNQSNKNRNKLNRHLNNLQQTNQVKKCKGVLIEIWLKYHNFIKLLDVFIQIYKTLRNQFRTLKNLYK